MAEYTAIAPQTVEANEPVLFSNMTVGGGCNIMHREGTGLFTLVGPRTCPCKGNVVTVTVGANMSIPTGGTAGTISAALVINGEIDNSTRMSVTPAAVEEPFNVYRSVQVIVPGGCCTQVTLENVSDIPVTFENVTIDFENISRR